MWRGATRVDDLLGCPHLNLHHYWSQTPSDVLHTTITYDQVLLLLIDETQISSCPVCSRALREQELKHLPNHKEIIQRERNGPSWSGDSTWPG